MRILNGAKAFIWPFFFDLCGGSRHSCSYLFSAPPFAKKAEIWRDLIPDRASSAASTSRLPLN